MGLDFSTLCMLCGTPTMHWLVNRDRDEWICEECGQLPHVREEYDINYTHKE